MQICQQKFTNKIIMLKMCFVILWETVHAHGPKWTSIHGMGIGVEWKKQTFVVGKKTNFILLFNRDILVGSGCQEGELKERGQMTHSGWQSVADRETAAGLADGKRHLHNRDKLWAGGVTIVQEQEELKWESRFQVAPVIPSCSQSVVTRITPDQLSLQSGDAGTVLAASPQDVSVGCD